MKFKFKSFFSWIESMPLWVFSFLLFFLNNAWFLPLKKYGTIMGDDVPLTLHAMKGFTLGEILENIRPVHYALAQLETNIAGNHYGEYFLINIGINCLISITLFVLCYRIGKSKIAAALLSCLYITCQFSYYLITQVYGMMEAMCILFLLGAVWFGISFYQTGRWKKLLLSVLFGLLTYGTHQRFLVLIPIYVILVLMCGSLNKKQKITYVVFAILPFAAYYYSKVFFFGTKMMMGTGGTEVKIVQKDIIGFFMEGLSAIFGINIGPEYLNGYGFLQFSPAGKACAILVSVCSVSLLVAFVASVIRNSNTEKRTANFKAFFLAICLAGATLLGGCITIRLEMRWILAPYVVFLIFLSYIISTLNNRKLGTACLAFMVMFSIPYNLMYRDRSVDKIYFYRAMRIGQETYNNVILQYGRMLKDYKLYFIGNDEMKWVINNNGYGGGSILDLYLGPGTELHYIKDESEIELGPKPVKLFKQKGADQVEEVFLLPRTETKYDLNRTDQYSFYPDTDVDTPNRKGVFLYDGDITVVSGYSLCYDDLDLKATDELIMSAYMPYLSSDGAHVTITIISDTYNAVICDVDVYPGTELSNQLFSIDQNCDDARIEVEVTSPSGDANADWIIFDQLAILEQAGSQSIYYN